MRAMMRWMPALLAAASGLAAPFPMGIAAAADSDVSVSVVPVRYGFVSGDDEKFRAQHWMKDGYAGGVSDFSAHQDLGNGLQFSAGGHALVDQNDLGGLLSIKKEDLGFINLDYSAFRKYYEGTGGVYYRFSSLPVNETNKDLHLDMGNLLLESGLSLQGLPALSFLYERETKGGAKSRLNWTAVKEGSTTRNIGPTWQDIDEVANTFTLKAEQEILGFAVTGQQSWEFMRADALREERLLSTTGVAADSKIRRQQQEPQSNLATSMLGGERWFRNDTVFFSGAYRFGRMKNREFESLLEYDANGNPRSFTNPKNKPNSRADNDVDTHTWVGNLMVIPQKWWNVSTKLKAEVLHQRSNSTYPSDTTDPPDGIANTTAQSITDNKGVRFGEGVSLRFTAIPRTALYSELELEQARLLLREDRRSLAGQSVADTNEPFNRETVTHVWRGTGTLGGQCAPWSFLDFTAHLRRRVNNNDYDDQRESDPGATTARSAFTDGQTIHTNELATRVTFKPCRWFRPSFRYQLRNDKYGTRAENEPFVKATTLSNIYTADASLQWANNFVTTLSFSRQTSVTSTPARLASSANTPAFHGDVNTWLLNADYMPTPAVTLNGALQFSRASNFNDFSVNGLPLGADYKQLDVSTGMTWEFAKDTKVHAEYAFYSYLPNSLVESGDYHAHVVRLEASKKF